MRHHRISNLTIFCNSSSRLNSSLVGEIMKIYVILAALALSACAKENEIDLAKDYYGWLGNCSDTAYEFNFDQKKWVLYSRLRVTQNATLIEKYSITRGEIEHAGDGAYVAAFPGVSPMKIEYSKEENKILGSSEEYGNVYFSLCEKDVISLVEKAIENEKSL